MIAKQFLTMLIVSICFSSFAQDRQEIESAVMDYVEGFYVGDTAKIIRSIHPDLSKHGYKIDSLKNVKKIYAMSYQRAIDFAREVLENPQWGAPAGAIKKIELLDVQSRIASVKLTAYWGVDYLLLVKEKEKWMITKVLWQNTD